MFRRIGFHFSPLLSMLALLAVHGAEHKPARWENDILAFEQSDRTNPPPAHAVLFAGSSSIRMWTNLASDFPGLQTIRRGFGGSRMADLTYYADRIVIPYRPAKIVVYEGDNDIAAGLSPAQLLSDFRAFVEKVRGALPKTKIYFISIKPSPSRWHLSPQASEANRLIQRFCRFRSKLQYIDIWTPMLGSNRQPDPSLFQNDNLHLNAKGYELWTRIVAGALKDSPRRGVPGNDRDAALQTSLGADRD